MFQRRIPEFLRHAPTPGVKGFALLAGVEAATRGVLMSVFPIAMYKTLGDAETVSEIYFLIGLVSMTAGLLTPWASRFIARRKLYTIGGLGMVAGGACAAVGGDLLLPAGMAINTVSTAVLLVCFHAYVMDYVERSSLGESETLRLFYSGAAWTIGPFLGIWLYDKWPPAPFLVSAMMALVMLVVFWVMRTGDGKVIIRARAPAPNPVAFLPRFLAQPRLVAGWMFAVIRSFGWWVFIVYMPIFAIESGYSDQLGGFLLSVANGMLFTTPLMLRWMRRTSVRRAVVTGFWCSGTAFVLAMAASDMPALAIGLMMVATMFMVLLDVSAGLPFLMAVKPSERTEMSAVYASYRDVSAVLTPGVARLVLAWGPLPMVFAATGLGLLGAGMVALRLHPRLGARRLAPAE